MPVEAVTEADLTGAEEGFIDPDGSVIPEILKEDKTEKFLNPTLQSKPMNLPAYKHTITFSRFAKIAAEVSEKRKDHWERKKYAMSMEDLINHIAKTYIGRRLSSDDTQKFWDRHRTWQRDYMEKVGQVLIPDIDMVRKVFELFNIGVGPKLD